MDLGLPNQSLERTGLSFRVGLRVRDFQHQFSGRSAFRSAAWTPPAMNHLTRIVVALRSIQSCVTGSLIVAMVLMVGCDRQDQHKADEKLIASFLRHRADFEQLRQMATADSTLRRVSDSWTDPPDLASAGVSPQRVAEYRRLLHRVGCPEGLMAFPARPGIRFLSSSRGLLNRGSSKGYCYLESVPPLLVTNTDTYRPELPGAYEVYRQIEGSWYLVLEHGN